MVLSVVLGLSCLSADSFRAPPPKAEPWRRMTFNVKGRRVPCRLSKRTHVRGVPPCFLELPVGRRDCCRGALYANEPGASQKGQKQENVHSPSETGETSVERRRSLQVPWQHQLVSDIDDTIQAGSRANIFQKRAAFVSGEIFPGAGAAFYALACGSVGETETGSGVPPGVILLTARPKRLPLLAVGPEAPLARALAEVPSSSRSRLSVSASLEADEEENGGAEGIEGGSANEWGVNFDRTEYGRVRDVLSILKSGKARMKQKIGATKGEILKRLMEEKRREIDAWEKNTMAGNEGRKPDTKREGSDEKLSEESTAIMPSPNVPPSPLIFLGDNGQGDPCAALIALKAWEENRGRRELVSGHAAGCPSSSVPVFQRAFIHSIRPLEKELTVCRDSVKREFPCKNWRSHPKISPFRNYADLAIQALEEGLMVQGGARLVHEAVTRWLETQADCPSGGGKDWASIDPQARARFCETLYADAVSLQQLLQ
uniref:Uncharacterized protein n=1 Tax=Chromera velia CCMP2878 TaxID=1169474 RepID=A0A0G4I4P3_9ALVE|eukprot:Cvel_10951.t1-p1 / transcript=Cvel_10951.t1 / gene=Cvel_10951 / organism=Chromera_velia_CCMP2878 / gene_product=hypothetical protein / transcript_product=hypothetical protein / location=Cvel_scaffold673:47721-49854(-) / protein_length=486 / sequence_SO=supercontig / SO=protein_coding / is_pseudo=false